MMRVKSKNIYVLPADKPSRLHFTEFEEELIFTPKYEKLNGINIYITSDEEIKEGDWVVANGGIRFVTSINNYKSKTFTDDGTISKQTPSLYCHLKHYKKTILTTDQDLIKDGVWGIEDGFLEWFVKNPACEYVELKGYAIILLEESCDCDKICNECKPKQETLEEVKDLAYYKTNAEEDYLQVPISVLRYISQLEQEQDKNKYTELVDLLERLTPIYREDTDLHQKWELKRLEIIEQFKKK
jgi:hypothetical protein